MGMLKAFGSKRSKGFRFTAHFVSAALNVACESPGARAFQPAAVRPHTASGFYAAALLNCWASGVTAFLPTHSLATWLSEQEYEERYLDGFSVPQGSGSFAVLSIFSSSQMASPVTPHR